MSIDLRSHCSHSRPTPAPWIALAAVLTAIAAGPTTSESTTRPTTRPDVIQPGDWLRVQIEDLNGSAVPFVEYVRVTSDGKISVPLIGPMMLRGQTAAEAAAKISNAFVSGVHPGPDVSITILHHQQPGEPPPRPIAVGDLIRVDLEVKDDGSRTVLIHRVANDGTLTFPQIGKVKVVDLNDSGVAKAVGDAYVQKRILNIPILGVITLEQAPAGAKEMNLSDEPINPVPEALKPLLKH